MANWAWVIGINNYQRLQQLSGAVRDAELMRDFFEASKFEQVFYYSDNSPAFLANGISLPTQPTYANLWSFLLDFFDVSHLQNGDNFWFFFSGHGVRHQGRDYIMPCDGHPLAVENTAISLNYITERLRRSGADNVILFLDACRNDDKGGLGIGQEQYQGVITISSCSPSEKSYEIKLTEEITQGAFTTALLEGMSIRGEGNCATVERLYQHLTYRVPQINQQYGKPHQSPYLMAEPPSKMHYILLPQNATIRDAEPMRIDALEAEAEENYHLAEQLWIRVLEVSPGDRGAVRAIQRIAIKIHTQPKRVETPPTPPLDPTGKDVKPVSKSSADLSIPSPTLQSPLNTPLKRFEFDIVTVTVKKGFFGNKISNQTRRGQAEYFTIDLGKGVTMDLVFIPGGKFLMGAPESEAGSSNDERPQHWVTVPSFYMGKYAVTQAQWEAVMGNNPSYFKGKNLPVEQVSWYDSIKFCQTLSKVTGLEISLPSEAQWEYACRASPLSKGGQGGSTTPFHFGETITPDLANYNGNYVYGAGIKGVYREKTIDVGSFPPNAFGLYDMHGNVWEWCADTWHDNYNNAPTDGTSWRGANGDNSSKALRGGSWYREPRVCRSAYRDDDIPRLDINRSGLRVVCAVSGLG